MMTCLSDSDVMIGGFTNCCRFQLWAGRIHTVCMQSLLILRRCVGVLSMTVGLVIGDATCFFEIETGGCFCSFRIIMM